MDVGIGTYFTGVVLDLEGFGHRAEVEMGRESALGLLQELDIHAVRLGVHGETDVVEQREEAGRSLSFDEFAHDLVVEILDGSPLNAFVYILLLLSLQCQFDKVLLEFLVHIIDTELLETVALF